MPDEPEAYFQVISEDDGYSVLSNMDNDEPEIVQEIIDSLRETRLVEETPLTIH